MNELHDVHYIPLFFLLSPVVIDADPWPAQPSLFTIFSERRGEIMSLRNRVPFKFCSYNSIKMTKGTLLKKKKKKLHQVKNIHFTFSFVLVKKRQQYQFVGDVCVPESWPPCLQ